MVASARNDANWTKPGSEMEINARELGFGEKSKFYLYDEMSHGWTIRGDVNDKKIARDVGSAFNNALEFFKSL